MGGSGKQPLVLYTCSKFGLCQIFPSFYSLKWGKNKENQSLKQKRKLLFYINLGWVADFMAEYVWDSVFFISFNTLCGFEVLDLELLVPCPIFSLNGGSVFFLHVVSYLERFPFMLIYHDYHISFVVNHELVTPLASPIWVNQGCIKLVSMVSRIPDKLLTVRQMK